MDEELPRLLSRDGDPGSPRDSAPAVSVALLDLDHFQRINDTYSHEVGDRVLRKIAGLLETAVAGAGPFPPSQADLLGRVDAHLYQAKRQGRDRVVSDAG